MTDALEAELKANYTSFAELLPELLGANRGKFALMRHREVVDFFDTARDYVIHRWHGAFQRRRVVIFHHAIKDAAHGVTVAFCWDAHTVKRYTAHGVLAMDRYCFRILIVSPGFW